MTTQKVSKGILFVGIGTVSFMVSGYLVNVWLGRHLGPRLYGQYGVLISLMTILNIMQVSGVPQAVSKYSAENPNHSEGVLRSGLKVQAVIVTALTVIFLLSAPLMAKIFNDPQIVNYIRLTALILPTYGLFALYSGYYNGKHSFGRQAIMDTAYSLAKLIFVVGLSVAYSLYGVIIGFIAAPVVALIFGFRWPKSKHSFPVRRLIMYSLPLIGFAVLSALQLSVDLFSVKSLISVTAAAGFYTAAQNIALIPYLGMGVIGQVLFPNISRLLGASDHEAAAEAATTALRWTLLLLLPLVALIIGTAPALVHILYGGRYAPAVPLLRVLVTGYIGLTIFALMANVLNGAGKARTAMFIAGTGVATALVFCLILIPHLGAIGAALSTGIGSVVVAGAGLLAARGVVRYWLNVVSLLRVLAGAAIVLGLGWLIYLPTLFLPIWWIVLGLVYLGWLLVTKELGAEDVAMVMSLISGSKKVGTI